MTSLSNKENYSMSEHDIWRDTNEEKRRQEWKSTAKLRRSVREEMDGWKPRNRESAKRMKQSISQIRLDVIRTWGTHSAYSTDTGRKALERVLVSWVAHDPIRIGYCQSMNFVAAMILAVCKGNEDEALTIFTCLMEDTAFGDYFHRETNFEALHNDTRKLEVRLGETDIQLAHHLHSVGFELASITPTWLLTCFFLPIGPSVALDVLDVVIKSGSAARECLIECALDILLHHRAAILKCGDIDEIFHVFKKPTCQNNV